MPGSWRGVKKPNLDCHQNLPAVCHGGETTDADTLTGHQIKHHIFLLLVLVKGNSITVEDPFDNCRGSTSNAWFWQLLLTFGAVTLLGHFISFYLIPRLLAELSHHWPGHQTLLPAQFIYLMFNHHYRPDPRNFTLDHQLMTSVAFALGPSESCCPLFYAAGFNIHKEGKITEVPSKGGTGNVWLNISRQKQWLNLNISALRKFEPKLHTQWVAAVLCVVPAHIWGTPVQIWVCMEGTKVISPLHLLVWHCLVWAECQHIPRQSAIAPWTLSLSSIAKCWLVLTDRLF